MSDFMKTATYCYKRRLFIKKIPLFIKNYFAPVYKKLQAQISVFMKKIIFWK